MVLYNNSILSDIIYDTKTFAAQVSGTEEVEMLTSEVKGIFSQVQNLNVSTQVNKNVESNHTENYKVNTPEVEIIGSEAQEILAMLGKVNLLDIETSVQSDALVSASNSLLQDEVISVNQDSGFKYIHYALELPIATL
ncbi:hypothetical protein EX227_01375 [Providencia rettgeri]|uniref:Uncharacterized protein n=4 Tax=Providencia rettgeri TaxID=587 RepID=A0A8E3YML0_PRORE|nr:MULTISPECIES: hypothetical protein [Providencia]HCI94965.1 hypothetical protein [Providencia sp.]EIU7556243.1 hypothetical protein [Providencia rettgeri]EJD6083507.1 hypothetical protein [Providencia rettgeri]EJD6498144.1 hypothetical protein [Providencia rettgeri]EJD6506138.1 hypothetical protein [Providencia rettgeri]